MVRSILRALALGMAVLTLARTTAAYADPVTRYVGADLAVAPYTFDLFGDTFTFAATGDFFNPLAVSTSSAGADSAFGGFLGIPLQPTSFFTDRDTVTFGPDTEFGAFPTLTTVPFSNGDNFIGLRAQSGGEDYFGFAYTSNAMLDGYGFETTPGTAITAKTISAAPEPSAWALMLLGVASMGIALRFSRRVARRPDDAPPGGASLAVHFA